MIGFRCARYISPIDDDDDDDDDDTTCADWVTVQNGTFTMGSPTSELGRSDDEQSHFVTLTHNISMSIYEVTQGQWTGLIGWNPSNWSSCGPDCAVESISWYDSLAYANALSTEAGYSPCYSLSNIVCEDGSSVASQYQNCMNNSKGGIDSATVSLNGVDSVYECEGYRLPTESEWEYVVRAGTTTAFYNGEITYTDCELDPNLDSIGWYCGNRSGHYGEITVGLKESNSWGLYDMSGNVWEWVWDWWWTNFEVTQPDPEGAEEGSLKVARGGSTDYGAKFCRSAMRGGFPPAERYSDLGFRLVRTLLER